jgi:tetratricopeptide (TPR) repeat protein
MKKVSIEELAYVLKQAKEQNQPKPIFFLGAGASKSGGIPLAKEIVEDILSKYPNAPAIEKLKEADRSYSKLMECLQPYERDTLLKEYIDKAKVNVTHIYLAQLIYNDFVDYVLTVNFDNLMLRALSLFNIFPSTYDMAILKDLTTTTFKEKSVVFLHGQHHGLWLLNTHEEMKKVNATVPRIFDSIKNKRPWVFIGYSGDDPIFEHVKNLGRYDNGLYWVTYNNNHPNEKVRQFLETPNTNASIIEGYDSDSFMIKLNTDLGLDQPSIINKPFTSLRGMLDNIVDIDDEEHFKGIKERLEIAKEQVDESIKQFEKGKAASRNIKKKSEVDLLKKEVIDIIIKEEFKEERINQIMERAREVEDKELYSLLSDAHLEKGNALYALAQGKEGSAREAMFNQAFEKYAKAIDIKPDKHQAFNNWGSALGNLARTKGSQEAEDLYHMAIEKAQKATVLGGSPYNLACFLGIQGNKEEALKYLETSLSKNEITVDFVEMDEDWADYFEDKEFVSLLNKYRTKSK